MLSNLDERNIYGEGFHLIESLNEKLLIEDKNGNTRSYVDLISAYGACNFGHNNREINKFFKSFKVDIAAGFYPKEAYEFCEWILNKLSLNNYEILFQVGGSFAVSTAISLAQHKKPGKVVFLNGAFHGLGLDSLSITVAQKDLAIQNTTFLNLIKDQFISLDPMSDDYKLIDWNDVSCFIFEPVQGANGYIPIDSLWLKTVIEYIHRFGVIVIADEIQAGYYRHGHLSLSSHNGYNADMYLFSKSLTNGLYPFSIIIYNKDVKSKLNNNVYLAHTFQTSALGCLALKSVAEFIDNHPLNSYCDSIEEILLDFEMSLELHRNISNVHVTKTSISFQLDDNRAGDLVKKCFKEGVLIFTGGVKNNRIRIAPPITIPLPSLKESLQKISQLISYLN